MRKNLADKNKPFKYLRYAIGEIVLVVLGILIALSINNWNTGRINNDLEKFYIKGILHDIESDLVKLNSQISLDSIKVSSGNFLLNHFKNPTFKKDSIILSNFMNLIPATYYQQNNIVFEDIKFSGRLNIISNDTLRNNIQRYYSHGEQVTTVLDTNSQLAIDLFGSHVYTGKFDMNSLLHQFGGTYANSEGMVEVTSFDSKFFYKSLKDPLLKEFIDRLSVNILLAQLNINRLNIGKNNAIELTNELRNYLN